MTKLANDIPGADIDRITYGDADNFANWANGTSGQKYTFNTVTLDTNVVGAPLTITEPGDLRDTIPRWSFGGRLPVSFRATARTDEAIGSNQASWFLGMSDQIGSAMAPATLAAMPGGTYFGVGGIIGEANMYCHVSVAGARQSVLLDGVNKNNFFGRAVPQDSGAVDRFFDLEVKQSTQNPNQMEASFSMDNSPLCTILFDPTGGTMMGRVAAYATAGAADSMRLYHWLASQPRN